MNKEKRNKQEKAEGFKFDIGTGDQLSLKGFFKGIGNLIDLASRLSEEGSEIKKQGEITFGKDVKGVYGFNIRTMTGGKPVIETFGNIKQTPKGPVVEEVREPVVDIFNEEDHIRVVAELPGVSEKNIKLEVKGDILKLSADSGDRKYCKEILLPSKIKEDNITSSYNNAILEIKLMKLSY